MKFSLPKEGNEANLRAVKLARKPVRRRNPSPAPGAWGVVWIDGEPIRKKVRRDYERARRDLEASRAEAERFENEDKPQFSRWLSANFGATLTEIRELQEKLFQAQALVNEVQQEFYYGNYRSISGAYKKVIRRREKPEEFERELEEEQAEAEELRGLFEEVWAEMGGGAWEEREADRNQAWNGARRQPESPPKASV